MIKQKKYKAQDLKGNWVTGWYAEMHISETDNHDKLKGYKTIPALFNDEEGVRSKGGYWSEILPNTLQEIETNTPKQLTIFDYD